MGGIAVNTKYIEDLPKNGDLPLSGKFYITSTLKSLGILKNEKVIFLHPLNDDDYEFIQQGVISEVKEVVPIIKENKSPEKFKHYYNYDIIKTLKNNNLLSDLEYSLTKVYSYEDPKKHFQQQFRNLDEEDFSTIINGWVYLSRTFFGKLINALPKQNRFEFILRAMDKFTTIDFAETSLNKGLDFLLEYIEDRIITKGNLLVNTHNIIQSKLGHVIDEPEEIGFINPITEESNKLSSQVQIFNELFAIESQTNIIKTIHKALEENIQSEIRFEKIFKRQSWPVNLKT